MRMTSTFALALGTAALITAPLTAPAYAHADGPDYYRVVNVKGSATLNLRARPGTFAAIIHKIPFNARRIRNAIQSDGAWTRINFAGHTGWVHSDYLAEDNRNGQTIYKITGLPKWDSLNMRKRPKVAAAIIGDIPGSAAYVEDCGTCKGVWCPVRYNKVDGWVHKKYLAVIAYPRDNRYSDNRSFSTKPYGPTYNPATSANRQDFRDLYSNQYMGLDTKPRPTWLERWQQRR